MTKDLGDFQTPHALISDVLRCLSASGKVWTRCLEPTCGSGGFISGLLRLPTPPSEIHGIEIQATHLATARKSFGHAKSTSVVIHEANLFNLDLKRDLRWSVRGPLLVVGNPPWVTNSELGALSSANLPRKMNIKGSRGLDALTGESNFDIAEYIWLKLVRELLSESPTIALLCKTNVARNVLKFAFDKGLPVSGGYIRKINAKKWFGASVDACLFCVDINSGQSEYELKVYPDLFAVEPDSVIGIVGKRLVPDVRTYTRSSFADGVCSVTWRQGLKHDAASVMELTKDSSGQFKNSLGENVLVETDFIYPLLKSSDLFHYASPRPHRSVIVTQRELGEDTRLLKQAAPGLWKYLTKHAEVFERRKSSIYINKGPFTMFGVGDYSFAQYKVGVSGLHKTARFRAIGPVNNRPVMLDDTCYLIACHSAEQAAFLASLLNSPVCLDILQSLSFTEAKRPITKKLLQRIDLKAVLDCTNRETLLEQADKEMKQLCGYSSPSWPRDLQAFLTEDFVSGSKGNADQLSLFGTA